jgi:TolA-binding protein
VIAEISLLTDSINAKYVSKSEFNSLVDDVNSFKALIAKELKNGTTAKASTSELDRMSSADVLKKADAFYKKRYYTDAIKYFEHLIKKNYKPAYSHFMIGEMNYKRKNYSNAISYFKKSSSLYSKAWYMPKLMLHTAISMSKTRDKAHARTFFEAVVAKYPNSPEAEVAREYLQP